MSGFMDSKLMRAPGIMKSRLLRRPLGKNLGAAVGREIRPEKWVFIIGCYNSGTTLLNSVLAKHPEIGSLPYEGVALTDQLPMPEQFGWPRLWEACESEMAFPAIDHVQAARRVKRQWSLSYPRGCPVLLEKSIANACRIPFLERNFSPAHFIYIVRNGYAVAEGIRRKAVPARWGNPDFPNGYPIEYCARQWARTCELVERDKALVANFKQITYEDLCEDPAGVVGSVLEFLSLSSAGIQDMIRPQRVHGRTQPIRNLNESSIAAMDDSDRAAVREVGSSWLDRFGYHDVG